MRFQISGFQIIDDISDLHKKISFNLFFRIRFEIIRFTIVKDLKYILKKNMTCLKFYFFLFIQTISVNLALSRTPEHFYTFFLDLLTKKVLQKFKFADTGYSKILRKFYFKTLKSTSTLSSEIKMMEYKLQ